MFPTYEKYTYAFQERRNTVLSSHVLSDSATSELWADGLRNRRTAHCRRSSDTIYMQESGTTPDEDGTGGSTSGSSSSEAEAEDSAAIWNELTARHVHHSSIAWPWCRCMACGGNQDMPSLELSFNVWRLFCLLDVQQQGHFSRVDALDFFRSQREPTEHVDGLFAEVGLWSTRSDGAIDLDAWVQWWQICESQLCMNVSELVILSRAMLVHRSWRWDDGRHLENQPAFSLVGWDESSAS